MKRELFIKDTCTLVNNSNVIVHIKKFKSFDATTYTEHILSPSSKLVFKRNETFIMYLPETTDLAEDQAVQIKDFGDILLHKEHLDSPMMIIDHGTPRNIEITQVTNTIKDKTPMSLSFNISNGTKMTESYCVVIPIYTYKNYEAIDSSTKYMKINLTSVSSSQTEVSLSNISLYPGDIIDVMIIYTDGQQYEHIVNTGIYTTATNIERLPSAVAYSRGIALSNRLKILEGGGSLGIYYGCTPTYEAASGSRIYKSILNDIDNLLDNLLETTYLIKNYSLNNQKFIPRYCFRFSAAFTFADLYTDYIFPKDDNAYTGNYNIIATPPPNYTYSQKCSGNYSAGILAPVIAGKYHKRFLKSLSPLTPVCTITSTSGGLPTFPGSGGTIIGGGSNYLG